MWFGMMWWWLIPLMFFLMMGGLARVEDGLEFAERLLAERGSTAQAR